MPALKAPRPASSRTIAAGRGTAAPSELTRGPDTTPGRGCARGPDGWSPAPAQDRRERGPGQRGPGQRGPSQRGPGQGGPGQVGKGQVGGGQVEVWAGVMGMVGHRGPPVVACRRDGVRAPDQSVRPALRIPAGRNGRDGVRRRAARPGPVAGDDEVSLHSRPQGRTGRPAPWVPLDRRRAR
ncbi:hypothetical protein DMB42_09710 [Nonomuraea sp. WAC 01424]|nr:hypothetical protein DMB42_09710 [Nonomuraea sp. WAC 01424]